MKQIKLINFFDREYDGPKIKIVVSAGIGGLSFGVLLYVINQAAEIASVTGPTIQWRLMVIYMLVCVVNIVLKQYTLNKTVTVAETAVYNVRVRLIDKIRHADLQFIESKKKGEIFARVAQDTQVIAQASPNLVNTFDSLIATFAVLLYIGFISKTGFIIGFITIIALYTILFNGYFKIKENLKEARLKEADFFNALHDTIAGFKEIRINSRKNQALFTDIEMLAEESKHIKTKAEISYDNNIIIYLAFYETALALMIFIVPLFSRYHGENLIKIVTAMLFILGSLTIAFRGLYAVLKANVAVDNLEKLEIELNDINTDGSTSLMSRPFKKIRLQSITFQYTGKYKDSLFTLGPVNLTIHQGEILFIIGGNGSGKSTLLKIIAGLYYPMAGGAIYLDNEIITQSNYQTYRELFSIIFTDFHLFKKLYGLDSVDEAYVKVLLKEMDIHQKTDYKNGRFTNIDLSTGQKKRLAYITALLEDRPIYIFDEWAADQDPVYKKYFYDRFLKDLRTMNKTVIAATHDDHYFDKADRVIKMEEGKIVEL